MIANLVQLAAEEEQNPLLPPGPELLVGTTTAVTAYEPATGKVVWEYPIVWPAGKMPLRVVGRRLG